MTQRTKAFRRMVTLCLSLLLHPGWSFCFPNVVLESHQSRRHWELASSRADLPHNPKARVSSESDVTKASKTSLYAPLQIEKEHAMNLDLMRELALGQVSLWGTVSLALFAWQPHLPLSWWHAVSTSSFTPTTTLGLGWDFGTTATSTTASSALAVGILLAVDTASTKLSPTNAYRMEFGTTNLVTALWGRRNQKQRSHNSAAAATTSTTTTTTTTTKDALSTTILLATVTALCQQSVFFHLLPGTLSSATSSFLPAALLPPVLFGLFHANPKTEENSLLVPLHILHGMVYTAVIVGTGTLWSAILAQTLYQSHVWTATWHKTNDQIDWAHAAPARPPFSAHDAAVWAALESHAQGALTPSVQALLSLFYAFDTDQRGYLSLENVQTAMAFTFWQQNEELPSPVRVKALFETLLDQRPSTATATSALADTTPRDRLSWVEFVRLLVSLRASAK